MKIQTPRGEFDSESPELEQRPGFEDGEKWYGPFIEYRFKDTGEIAARAGCEGGFAKVNPFDPVIPVLIDGVLTTRLESELVKEVWQRDDAHEFAFGVKYKLPGGSVYIHESGGTRLKQTPEAARGEAAKL